MSKERSDEKIYRFYKRLRNALLIVAIPLWVIAYLTKHHAYAVDWSAGAMAATGYGIVLTIILHIDSKPLTGGGDSDGTTGSITR